MSRGPGPALPPGFPTAANIAGHFRNSPEAKFPKDQKARRRKPRPGSLNTLQNGRSPRAPKQHESSCEVSKRGLRGSGGSSGGGLGASHASTQLIHSANCCNNPTGRNYHHPHLTSGSNSDQRNESSGKGERAAVGLRHWVKRSLGRGEQGWAWSVTNSWSCAELGGGIRATQEPREPILRF